MIHFSRILSLQEINKNLEEKNNVIEQDFKKNIDDIKPKKSKDLEVDAD